MQATVYRYERDSGQGSCLLDDGIELPLAPGALDGSGIRHLRPGQRVTVTLSEDEQQPRIESVRINGVTP